jgi:Protein of unknown function (DUF4240)
MKPTLILIFSIVCFSCNNLNNNSNTSFFDKLFGEKNNQNQTENKTIHFDTTQLAKTAEMLNEDVYWAIIDKSLKNGNSVGNQEAFLVNAIGQLTPKEMIGFRLRTDKLLHDTYTSEMWCAGYIMNGGCSDDGFEYFRNWIISRGKETYYKAKANPDNLIEAVLQGAEFYEFESFSYVALTAFENKTGKQLYDYIENENFKKSEGSYPKIQFNWQEENPESMKKICPQLFDKLWGK